MGNDDRQHDQHSDQGNRTVSPALIIASVIFLLVLIFVIQNTEEVTVEFLFVDATINLWILVLIILVLGALLGQSLVWLRNRSKRRRARAAEER